MKKNERKEFGLKFREITKESRFIIRQNFHVFQKICLTLRSTGTRNWKINCKIVESMFIDVHYRE